MNATALQGLNLTSLQAWEPNQRQIDQWAVNTETLDALLNRQNALGNMVIDPLINPNKKNEVRIWWNDFCGREATDCTNDNGCGPLTANPSKVDFKDYEITGCIKDGFSINEETFTGSFMSIEQNFIDNQNKVISNLLNKLNQKAIVFLEANAGLNKGGQFVESGGKYIIPNPTGPSSSTIYTKIIRDGIVSRLNNPFILDYGNFWEMNMNAQFEQGNGEGKGNAARSRYFNIVSDLFGGTQVPAVAGTSFLVAPYAFAFVNKSFFQKRTHPVNGHVEFTGSIPKWDDALGKYKWYINIPGYNIVVDVLKSRQCINGNEDTYSHVFQYRLTYDFLLNPTGCPNGDGDAVSGIIAYQNETIPASS